MPFTTVASLLPGVAVACALGLGAFGFRLLPGFGIFSPAILAVVLGILARRIAAPAAQTLKPGLTLSTRTLLRLAVALLGLQITLSQIVDLGLPVLLAVVGGLCVCFFATLWMGKRLGVSHDLTRLIGIGTSVCGASAVVAGNSVVRGDDEDVAYALAAVTVFGTISMLALPLLALWGGLDLDRSGLWMGASIHEVAQVVGAASQLGDHATGLATVSKMARVALLAPVVVMLAAMDRGKAQASERAKVPLPWFLFAFLGLSVVASLGFAPAALVKACGLISSFLLAAALGAMGYGIEVKALRRRGARPLLLALFASILIAAASLLFLSWAL